MSMSELRVRQAIVESCSQMNASGLNHGSAGNIGVRYGDRILITPSGVPYHRLDPQDIVSLDFDGGFQGNLQPSTEWRFHRDILATRPTVGAVVHAHPPYATALAICRREIPAVHYMIAAAGGNTIRCAPYATFGTAELSSQVLTALQGRHCCLLANHGLIATGSSLQKAMWLALETENLARQYILSLTIGDPHVLSEEEIAINIEKFSSYGPRDE
ncbi:MAG: class II aldolase/adducin family protein [Gammaproteobacteria bacterium]|nr:class II aldolase/adducin family protein [Gammaproteobacteria bacterium]